MSVAISLTPHGVRLASEVGRARHAQALADRLTDRSFRSAGRGLDLHVNGAAGEMAACLVIGCRWPSSVGTFKLPDVPEYGIEVKTRGKRWHDLRLFRDSDPNLRYVLVTGVIPHFRVVGWAIGSQVMLPKYWTDPDGHGAAWFVPQSKLLPISGLSEIVAQERRARAA